MTGRRTGSQYHESSRGDQSMTNPGGRGCLECDRAVPDGRGLVCGPQCAAVMALVRYGRRQDREMGLEPERVRPLKRRAKIIGRMPTDRVRRAVLARSTRCEVDDCSAPPEIVDFRLDDPDLQHLVRAEDLRTVCAQHHRSESLRRFVGPAGATARTAPALWARIWAEQPLVARDNEALWNAPLHTRLLTSAPGPGSVTQEDVERFKAAVDAAADDPNDPTARINAALDQVRWTHRQRDTFVRALIARILATRARHDGE